MREDKRPKKALAQMGGKRAKHLYVGFLSFIFGQLASYLIDLSHRDHK
jgi:hypothetical protein